jgi:hypothetical protein
MADDSIRTKLLFFFLFRKDRELRFIYIAHIFFYIHSAGLKAANYWFNQH